MILIFQIFLGNVVKEIAVLHKFKERGRRYSRTLKEYCLSMFYSSPRTYRRIATNFQFPSVSTLHRMTQKIKLGPGLNDFIFKNLETKMEGKSNLERMCILAMDEVSLKAHLYYDVGTDEIIGLQNLGYGNDHVAAQNGMVLMARGIDDKWKQNLGYFFIHTNITVKDLKKIIEDCVQKLNKAGLYVRVLTSDLGTNFNKFSKMLGVTINKPYFQIQNMKIYYIFDVPHLIKIMRNIILENTVEFEDMEATWKFVEKLFELEKENNLRMVPKLTQIHIKPNNFQRMKVKYATQVLSATVGAAISTCISKGLIEGRASGTVNFIEKMDRLFDMLNSSGTGTKNQHKKPYTGKKKQKDFLLDMLESIKKMKVYRISQSGKVDITNRFNGPYCFQVTIRSVMGLFEDLNKEGLKHLKTRRLNQDCLENFFGKIRQQQGNAVNPTPVQFMSAFKKLTCLDFLDTLGTFNCEEDADETLLNRLNDTELIQNPVMKCPFQISNEEFRKDAIEEKFMKKNVETYIAGYIIQKCLKKHDCPCCQDYSRLGNMDGMDENRLFTYFKGDTDKCGQSVYLHGKLRMPARNFLEYVTLLEASFNKFIVLTRGRIVEELYERLQTIPFNHPCPQFPSKYALTLFIRFVSTSFNIKFIVRWL